MDGVSQSFVHACMEGPGLRNRAIGDCSADQQRVHVLFSLGGIRIYRLLSFRRQSFYPRVYATQVAQSAIYTRKCKFGGTRDRIERPRGILVVFHKFPRYKGRRDARLLMKLADVSFNVAVNIV